MAEQELSQEERILQMMKRVLTDIARETHVQPGVKPPLSDNTILNIRDCLSLIVARERELAEAAGREMNMRPRYIDEPKKTVVVSLEETLLKKKKKQDENTD